MKTLVLVLALLGQQSIASPVPQTAAPPAVDADSLVASSSYDSLDIERRRSADSAYIEILEKTNSQLSLWLNPYGVMIGALGTLFAVAAIVAGVLLFRQGKEYRDLIETSIRKYEGVLGALVKEKLEAVEGAFERQLKDAQAKLAAELDEPKRKALERRIAEIEQHQALLKSVHSASVTDISTLNLRGTIMGTAWPGAWGLGSLGSLGVVRADVLPGERRKCTKCGTEIVIPFKGLLDVGPRAASCSSCGNVELLNDESNA